LGICGTGMAAAATLMKEKGHRVTGSDIAAYPPISTYLKKTGISFARSYDPTNLNPRPDLVVIGNALSRGNPEVETVLDLKIPYLSLPELLKEELIRGKRSLVVTGTHGKTTSTALLAWVLEKAGRAPSFFVGGIPLNFGRGIRWTPGQEVVVEGDEYDSAFFDKRPKFVHYLPDLLIINNIEFDHADIYPDLTSIERAFTSAQRLIGRRGLIVANIEDSSVRRVLKQTFCPVEWFGLKRKATWNVKDVKAEGEAITFSLLHEGKSVGRRLYLPLMGTHNVFNATAVYATCHWLGLSHKEIEMGFQTFRGVHRRTEKRGVFQGVTVLDDFAHHPTAITKTLDAISLHYPGRPIWAIFEPRTNTARRNMFQQELAGAFRGASHVIIGAVYGHEAIETNDRLDPVRLAHDIDGNMSIKARYIPRVRGIVDFLSSHVRVGEIVVVMSSGNFGGLIDSVVRKLGNTGEHQATRSRGLSIPCKRSPPNRRSK
jgi:UDP-N-acetylmuramate: L-alanyl-gamma-D-glutamyl-meso-diaminopimelate ligase